MVYHPWQCSEPKEEEIKALSGALGLPELVCSVLLGRGFDTPQKATAFLQPEGGISSPSLMLGMEAAAQRIRAAIDNGEKVAVFGDYDVDGVCATALMYSYLESAGAQVYYKLPNRTEDGYGLSKAAIDLIASRGITLIITVDNGISALEEIAYAASLGVDVVVTDHHRPPAELPPAIAIVNPQLPGDESPCKQLSGVGVAFKVICAVEQTTPEELLDWYGDLVAIGTVADIMSLTGENRVMVRHGVELLQQAPRPGLAALLQVAGVEPEQVTAERISFTLAPRLNAAGRMDDATASLRLLLTEDEEEAQQLAQELNNYNLERQKTEHDIVDQIAERIRADAELSRRRVIVMWGEGYHQGVIGIVASRLVERFGRPAIVFSIDGGEAKGSGRSVPGFSLYEAVAACSDKLLRFGGHDLAAGMSVATDRLQEFAQAINEYAMAHSPVLAAPPLVADTAVQLGSLTTDEVEALSALAPFGSGNPSPLFLLKNAVVDAVYPVSEGRHCRLRLRQGSGVIYAILFGVSPSALVYKVGDAVDAMLSLSVYVGQNGPMVSARAKELRPAKIGNEYIHYTELYRSFAGGSALGDEDRHTLLPSRQEIATVFRYVRAEGLLAGDLRPFFLQQAPLNAGKVLVALRVLVELGLIEKKNENGAERYVERPVSEKKDLSASAVLASLTR